VKGRLLQIAGTEDKAGLSSISVIFHLLFLVILSNIGSSFSLALLAFWAPVMDVGDIKVVIQST